MQVQVKKCNSYLRNAVEIRFSYSLQERQVNSMLLKRRNPLMNEIVFMFFDNLSYMLKMVVVFHKLL